MATTGICVASSASSPNTWDNAGDDDDDEEEVVEEVDAVDEVIELRRCSSFVALLIDSSSSSISFSSPSLSCCPSPFFLR